jgi:hypothetical protein
MGIFTEVLRIIGAKAALKASINAKGGTLNTELIDEYASAVDGISSDATATESDILLGKTAYAGGEKKTGTSTLNANTTDATLTANDMLYGVTGYGPYGTKLTGAGANWQYAKTLAYVFYNNSGISGAVVLYAPNATSIGSAFSNNAGLTSVDLTFGTIAPGATTILNAFLNCTSLTSIILRGNLSSSSDWTNFFRNCTRLVTIEGDALNASSCTSFQNTFLDSPAIENIAFVASTIKTNLSISQSPLLSTASLLSIANGLDGTAVGKTLTMHATSKTNMGAIMVDNVDGVAVQGIAMTLTQFINNIKEWTIA